MNGATVIVVDASVLSNALADLGSSGANARHRLLTEESAAPDLALIETAAVLRKRWMRGSLSEREFRDALAALRRYPLATYGAASLLNRAFELRNNVSAYDAMYIALAEGLRCPLVTGDVRLAEAPGIRCTVEVLTD